MRLLKTGTPTNAKMKNENAFEYFDEKLDVKRTGKIFIDSNNYKKNKNNPCLYFPGRKKYSMLLPNDRISFNKKNLSWEIFSEKNLVKTTVKVVVTKTILTGFVGYFIVYLINYFS